MRRALLSILLVLLPALSGAQTFVRWIPPPNLISFTEGASTVTSTKPLLLPDGTPQNPAIAFASDWDGSTPGWYRESANIWSLSAGSSAANYRFAPTYAGWGVSQFGFGNSAASPWVTFIAEAANTLALRNSTNAQAFNIYNTYTDGSNYERFQIAAGATATTLYQQYLGTGVTRPVAIGTTGDSPLYFNVNNATRWVVQGNSNAYSLTPNSNDQANLGLAANQVASLYLSRSIQGSKTKTLTESSATTLFRVAVPQGDWVHVDVSWDVWCSDGTDFVLRGMTSSFHCLNKAGTESCGSVATSEVRGDVNSSGGTLTTSTGVSSVSADTVDFSITATCSLTQTVLDAYYRLDMLKPQTVTPQ